ncbi:MAG TPA: arsenite methyltransferase [Phycisphaerales bacterium]|nr:arsenite methyltransferase [Phycisphaerales bacterium]HRQ74924.1 arsenite methyltransferase [Phycisphaerales bacterium]
MSSTTSTALRDQVSRDYERAVTSPTGGVCCAGIGCCTPTAEAPIQKGVVAKMAGYTDEELASLPPEAVTNSFGCGNPLALAQLHPGDVVLDLGSGAGIDILLAARLVGPKGRAIGIDMTDAMIAKAHENIAASGLTNVEVRKGIIEEMPVENDSVDWVISNCVVNLSPEKHRVFAEIARVLKPGGRVRISDIVVESLPDWVRGDRVLYSACISGAISEEAYLEGLRDAGLVDVEVTERLMYDEAQLGELIHSELPASRTDADNINAASLAREMVGKVWSAKFAARKP